MNTERDLVRIRAWEQANPEKRKRYNWNSQWKRGGIKNADGSCFTAVDYDRAYQVQQGRCLCCGVHQSEIRGRFHADHNHKTGAFRALLCSRCNQALGLARENPDILRRLASFIEGQC